jgi:hypothetical protein
MDLSNLTRLELHHLIVLCRVQRSEMEIRKVALEEKIRSGWDGPTGEAILTYDNEIALLSGIITKLWKAYNNP